MKNLTKKAELQAKNNPLKLDKERIKNCLVKLNYSAENIDESVDTIWYELHTFVSAIFQDELDYYLDNQEIKDSVVGKEIEKYLSLHLNDFFSALSTMAIRCANE